MTAPEQEIKQKLEMQSKKGVVVMTTPDSFKWKGSVQWPEPDEWDMEHWEFYRSVVYDVVTKRKGTPPHDNVREDFIVALRFTLEYGSADFEGVDIPAIVSGKAKIKPRFMAWVYNQWTPYIRTILDPKD